MNIQQVLNSADTIHVGMNVEEAIRVYSLYYGLTAKYCDPAIFKGDNGKYYSLMPRAILVELNEEEIKKELLMLHKCKFCNVHIPLFLDENQGIPICDTCGAAR